MIHMEVWKPIEVFQSSNYQVSNLGRVRRIDPDHPEQTRYLKPSPNPVTGYVSVTLYDSITKRSKSAYIHRLVAQAFIPNPNGYPQVDHIDNDLNNNVSTNLRWVTRQFNNSRSHARRMKRLHHVRPPRRDVFLKAVKGGETRYFKNANQCAKELGFSHVLALKALRGDITTAKGWSLEHVNRELPECRELAFQLERKRKERTIPPCRRLAHERRNAIEERIHRMKIDFENESHYRAMNDIPRPQGLVPISRQVCEFKRESRKVLQLDENGNLIKEWDNINQVRE